MNIERDCIPDIARSAVELVLRGDYDKARSAIGSIDYKGLIAQRQIAMRNRRSRLAQRMIWKEKSPQTTTLEGEMRGKLRTAVPDALMLTTFERDHFTCRYSHCKKRTIYIPVLQALSALFPDIIPYHSNWTPLEEHIIYWTYCTSLEHRISFPHGGTSNPENLITACYLCNDIKNMIRATDLGWEVGKIQAEDWDGLKSYLPALMEAVARRAPEGTSGTRAGGLVLLFLNTMTYYLVDSMTYLVSFQRRRYVIDAKKKPIRSHLEFGRAREARNRSAKIYVTVS